VKRLFAVALGILTAIGGFVDIGDLVTNAAVGSRFGLSLVWVVAVGVLGICVFAEMSGRVAEVNASTAVCSTSLEPAPITIWSGVSCSLAATAV